MDDRAKRRRMDKLEAIFQMNQSKASEIRQFEANTRNTTEVQFFVHFAAHWNQRHGVLAGSRSRDRDRSHL
jgi:hypothetical protein